MDSYYKPLSGIDIDDRYRNWSQSMSRYLAPSLIVHSGGESYNGNMEKWAQYCLANKTKKKEYFISYLLAIRLEIVKGNWSSDMHHIQEFFDMPYFTDIKPLSTNHDLKKRLREYSNIVKSSKLSSLQQRIFHGMVKLILHSCGTDCPHLFHEFIQDGMLFNKTQNIENILDQIVLRYYHSFGATFIKYSPKSEESMGFLVSRAMCGIQNESTDKQAERIMEAVEQLRENFSHMVFAALVGSVHSRFEPNNTEVVIKTEEMDVD